ncbi:MAG: hypothetical protein KAH04_03195 [Psychrilyobacter sp.]|nr:hypothetical protein [Psychrilyobacter sp.]
MKMGFKILKIILILIVLIFIFLYFTRNIIIEKVGEKIGTSEYGAKIDIDSVNYDVFHSKISFERVQVTDKEQTMKNIMDIKKISIDFQYLPLLKKLVVVDDIDINLIEFYTKRDIDGKVHTNLPVELPKNEEKKKKVITKPKIFASEKLTYKNLSLNIKNKEYEKALDTLDLKIVKEYNTESEKVKDIYTYWENKMKAREYKDKIKNLNEKYKILENTIKTEKDPIKLANEIEQVKKMITDIDKIIEQGKNDKVEFKRDLEKLVHVKNKAFSFLTFEDPFKNIIGWDNELLKTNVNLVLNEILGKYIKKNIDYAAILTGENKAAEKTELPIDFYIKKINLGVKYNDYLASGGLEEIASKVELTSKPMKIYLKGENNEIHGEIIGSYNRQSNNGNFHVSIAGLKIDTNIGEENKYLKALEGSELVISHNTRYENKNLFIQGNIILKNLKFDIKELKIDEVIKKELTLGLKKVDEINVMYKYNQNDGKISIKTNINKLISDIIGDVLNKNIEKYKKIAKEQLDKNIAIYSKKLNKEISQLKDLEFISNSDIKSLEELEEKIKDLKNPQKKIDDGKKIIEDKMNSLKIEDLEDPKSILKDLENSLKKLF